MSCLCICVWCIVYGWASAVCVHVSVVIFNRRHGAPWTIPKLMELSTSQCVCRLICVGLWMRREMDEVTVAYIIYEMPHRFSWNQLFIIAPDRVVHPQPQHWATGEETHWISNSNSQNSTAKMQRPLFFTCDILYILQHTQMNMWRTYLLQWNTFVWLKLRHAPFD